MKILQVINSLATGGAEKLLLDTVPLYRKLGIEMDVLVFLDNDFMFMHELKKLDCCNIFILKKSTNYKHIYDPRHIFKIAKLLKQYDIAHVHLFPAQYFVVIANLLIGNKCKLIFTEHNTSNTRMASTIFSKIDQFIYKGFKKVVAITNDVNLVLQQYLNSNIEKIVTIENGVDLAEVKRAVALNRNELIPILRTDDKLLVQVGGFRVQKDQDTVIKALRFLPDNFHLLLVGDGERKSILEALVVEMGIENRVHFLGVRQDIFSILKAVDYVIVSSHWEGFGLAAVEGMGASKPVIASNVIGLNDVVGGAGVLFEKGNFKQFAKNILKLNSNSDYYNNIVESCEKRAVLYDIHKMIGKHIVLYRNILDL
jgi:glycosyltransferase involved in cell wall biosynthesis